MVKEETWDEKFCICGEMAGNFEEGSKPIMMSSEGRKRNKCLLKESPQQIKSGSPKTKEWRINFSTDMKCSESDKSCH